MIHLMQHSLPCDTCTLELSNIVLLSPESLFSFLGTYEKKSIDLKSANYELECERDELMKRLTQVTDLNDYTSTAE